VADAVVVGGGILGLCAALHLRELGAGKVVVVEREAAPGTQTTAAGAGFAAYWGGGEQGAELVAYGHAFYARLQAEDRQDVGVRRVGLLFPALSPNGMEFLREQERESRFVEGLRLLDGGETCAVAPIIAPGAVLGALYQPHAHQVPTTRVAAALARRLVAMGVEIRCTVDVHRAIVTGGRVSGVETSAGPIAAGMVINAAGAGARALGLRNGVHVAAAPLPESRFVTEPMSDLPAELPMLLFFERDLLYLRGEDGGLLVGAIERELDDGAPPQRAVERHERLARSFDDVIPILGRARPAARAYGFPTFTPDGGHIVGRTPGIDGYVVLCGCNESGVTHGPGLGRLAAQLALGRATEVDPSPYRVERFGRLSEAELRQRAKATYLRRRSEVSAAAQAHA
jgi:glycine/D-amino acid oxidase-like deaminating enzyme